MKRIHPIPIFDFDGVIAALSPIRRGQHTGKIIVSHCGQNDVQFPMKPAMGRLSHLILISRSGLSNEESLKVIGDCVAHGCAVKQARGDVGDLNSVRRTFV